MPLSATEIKNAKPTTKPQRLFDGGGLYLEVAPSGGKWWRLKYRFAGREKRLSLGVFPDVSLKEARTKRDDARKLLSGGIDPSESRKAAKLAGHELAANTFEALAREFLQMKAKEWGASHLSKMTARLEQYVFPHIGGRAIATLAAPDVLAVLRRIEVRGVLSTAHRVSQAIGQIFRFAVVTGRADRDPTSDLRGALPAVKQKHFAAITDTAKLPDFLRALHAYTGGEVVRAALKIAPMTFARPGELRKMEWADIDFDAKEWRFISSKTRKPHIVPLAAPVLAILRDLHGLTGRGKFVFATGRGGARPMSENGVLTAMRSLGIGPDEMTGHGFRAMARTILDETLGFRADFIEHQLAHKVAGPLGAAYNRATHLAARREMMEKWAAFLEDLRLSPKQLPRA